MRFTALFAFTALLLCAQSRDVLVSQPEAQNVNSRYTVEGVELEQGLLKRLSRPVREQLDHLVGNKFDAKQVSDLAGRIAKEVRLKVSSTVERGSQPEHVRVIFRAAQKSRLARDTSLEQLRYNSQLGASASIAVDLDEGHNRFAIGFLSDAETHLEREIGWRLNVSRLITERARVKLDFEALHQKWNGATLSALAARPDLPGVYRERYSVEPSVEFGLWDGVTVSTGFSLQHFETQFPAARFEASNAWNNTLRIRKHWESDDSYTRQGFEAGYNLRVATAVLDSDFDYVRHEISAAYHYRFGREEISVSALAGELSGRAPLFERFVVGDSTSLRGWNRFDVDPLGGDGVLHASAQYRYRRVAAFYDTGSVWERGGSKRFRHSAGLTAVLKRNGEGPYLTVAFPVQGGSITPVLLLGMNF